MENLKVGDKVCLITMSGLILRSETIVSETEKQVVTDKKTRIIKTFTHWKGYKQFGSDFYWDFWSEERQKESDNRAIHERMKHKVHRKLENTRIASLSLEQLQRLDEAINWID